MGHGLLVQHRTISLNGSVVVLRTAHAGVCRQEGVDEQRGGGRLAVEIGGEDRGDRLAGVGAEGRARTQPASSRASPHLRANASKPRQAR